MTGFEFYDGVERFDDFSEVGDPGRYAAAPDDWFVAAADVVRSTEAIAAGRYKAVNMAGAAVIAAAMNALGRQEFPFAFGGDGATLAAPGSRRAAVEAALAATRVWARSEMALDLRVAAAGVAEIRAAGREVAVARFRPSPYLDYAMFSGGGGHWLTDEMKAGRRLIAEAAPDARPDLSGLSCRWAPMAARRGLILSLIADPTDGADAAAFAALMRRVLSALAREERDGNPTPPQGPGLRWSPEAMALEAQAAKGAGGDAATALKAIRRQSMIAWALFKTGLPLAGLRPNHYRRVVSANSDVRKFDDGLRLTADCSEATAAAVEAMLAEAEAAGICRFGLHRQDQAIMTCLAPDYRRDDHMHFVDGAAGGYAMAATRLKEKSPGAAG